MQDCVIMVYLTSLFFTIITLHSVFEAQAFTPDIRNNLSRNVFGASTATALKMNWFNDGKIKLVKTLAGDYDEVAVRAKVEELIQSEPVLMLSFSK